MLLRNAADRRTVVTVALWFVLAGFRWSVDPGSWVLSALLLAAACCLNHARNFTGRLFNWVTFNNAYHTIHHMEPGLHWSLLPARHRQVVSPHIHPELELPSMALYLLRTFFVPGGRRRYDGTPRVLPPAEPDQPWGPAAHTRQGPPTTSRTSDRSLPLNYPESRPE